MESWSRRCSAFSRGTRQLQWSAFGSLKRKEMLLSAVSLDFKLENTPKQLLVIVFFIIIKLTLMKGGFQEYSGSRQDTLTLSMATLLPSPPVLA